MPGLGPTGPEHRINQGCWSHRAVLCSLHQRLELPGSHRQHWRVGDTYTHPETAAKDLIFDHLGTKAEAVLELRFWLWPGGEAELTLVCRTRSVILFFSAGVPFRPCLDRGERTCSPRNTPRNGLVWVRLPRSCLGRSTAYSHGLSLLEVDGGKVNHGVMVTSGD